MLCRRTSKFSIRKVIKKLTNQSRISAEDQEQIKQTISGTFSSVLSEIITEFKDGMPDLIDKILKEKLSTQPFDQEDRVSPMAPVDRKIDPEVQHVPPTLEQNVLGFSDTPPKITRDIGSLQTNKDVGSCIKIITDVGSGVNKDDPFFGWRAISK